MEWHDVGTSREAAWYGTGPTAGLFTPVYRFPMFIQNANVLSQREEPG